MILGNEKVVSVFATKLARLNCICPKSLLPYK